MKSMVGDSIVLYIIYLDPASSWLEAREESMSGKGDHGLLTLDNTGVAAVVAGLVVAATGLSVGSPVSASQALPYCLYPPPHQSWLPFV